MYSDCEKTSGEYVEYYLMNGGMYVGYSNNSRAHKENYRKNIRMYTDNRNSRL
jgi:transposase